MNRLKEIHFLKGKANTREELLALEKEQIELENSSVIESPVTPESLATKEEPVKAKPPKKSSALAKRNEPESLEDALIN